MVFKCRFFAPMTVLFAVSQAALNCAAEPGQWVQSFNAGYADDNGAFAGGSEIMHLAAHKGKLYAANGYWLDSHWEIPPDAERQSAQVLRLDSTNGQWQVDLDTGKSNELGLGYMKGNILKSVTFTCDAPGKKLAEPATVLVMAAGARFERGGAVSVWVRDDESGKWAHTLVRHGSAAGGVRWVPRDMEVYRDKVTGVERLFLSLGNPGIITGRYDPREPSKIRWSRHVEFPFLTKGSFRTRPLGIAQANGSLFFSVDDAIYQRVDGERPDYVEVINLGDDIDTDTGGVRGLTAIKNPNGTGESLLFVWAPGDGSRCEVKRLDPDGHDGYSVHDEVVIMDLMKKALGVDVTYTLAAHNMMYPVRHPVTGETVHVIGFQGNIRGNDRLRWKGSPLYGGAMYAIRSADKKYAVHEVNNAFAPGKTPLVSPRTFCMSPFDDDALFIGGHDASNRASDNMAWIFKAPINVALGAAKGRDAVISKTIPSVQSRWDEGPAYELRTYVAAKDRFGHLVKRFRNHTDRLFKKHNMEPVGYWVPTEGPPTSRRTFVYILKHPSRYDAWQNWIRFTNDREWRDVLNTPEFRGLLIQKPESIFMTANDYCESAANAIEKPGGIFELRTYKANDGKLKKLNTRFRDHTTRIFNRHGINNVGYWTPLDKPESGNTLIYLVHHTSREQADTNWNSFSGDSNWQKVARESQVDGKLLAKPLERIFLKPLDFSPLK